MLFQETRVLRKLLRKCSVLLLLQNITPLALHLGQRGGGGGGRGSISRQRLCSPEIKTFQFGRELKVSYLLTHLILEEFDGSSARVLLSEGNLIST